MYKTCAYLDLYIRPKYGKTRKRIKRIFNAGCLGGLVQKLILLDKINFKKSS